MANRNRWIVSSLIGLFLTAVAGLAYAAASEEAAAGAAAESAGSAGSDGSDAGATHVRQSKIKLVLDHDGNAEQIELEDLQDLELGESRALSTASGTPVVVTRDEQGFEIDLDGKKIRLTDHFAAPMSDGDWTSEDGTQQIHRRVMVQGGGPGDQGGANVMIVRNKVAMDAGAAVVAGSEGDHDVVMLRRSAGNGHAFAFATGDGELPAMALPVEATIERLQASPKFQELDAATRTKVLEALRESAPAPGDFLAGEPGARTIVLEVEEEGTDDAN
ncbi:MAG: hypothetical protein ABIV06_14230 [Thermoanaerobaculia bacterium]